jgi:hypothetical protein
MSATAMAKGLAVLSPQVPLQLRYWTGFLRERQALTVGEA